MKRLFFLILFLLFYFTYSQTVGVGVAVENNLQVNTSVNVEDNSVEAVKEYWSQKRYSDAMANIQRARENRISSWVNKPFSGEDLSSYKYLILLPPRKHHKDIKRNLKKKMKGIPIEYVNVQEPNKTHDRMPKEVRTNPDEVLYLTVDLRAPYLVETYMQIYNSYGDLIYSLGHEAMSASSAFKILKNELEFALLF